MLPFYETPPRCDSLGMPLFARGFFMPPYFDPKSNVQSAPTSATACAIDGVAHHRCYARHRTLRNEKLVPLPSHHLQRRAVVVRAIRGCRRSQVDFHEPCRLGHIVCSLGNLVFDSTARKDDVSECLTVDRVELYRGPAAVNEKSLTGDQ